MHQIAQHMMERYDCYFTPYYADGIENLIASLGWLNFTVLGGRHWNETHAYLTKKSSRSICGAKEINTISFSLAAT